MSHVWNHERHDAVWALADCSEHFFINRTALCVERWPRYSPSGRNDCWHVCYFGGPEASRFLKATSALAVVDDFGNLVRIGDDA